MDLSTRLDAIEAICKVSKQYPETQQEANTLIIIVATESDALLWEKRERLKRYGIDLAELETS